MAHWNLACGDRLSPEAGAAVRFGRGTTGSMALPLLRVSLLRRGSSCAVENGGRPGVPPLRGIRKVSFFVRAGHRPSHVPGDRKGRPYEEKRTGSVGSVNSGAVVKSQSPQFLQTQGPVARREFRQATQILRAGNFSRVYRRTSPVMGSGESGLMGTKCPTAASPVAFWLLCRHGQSNSPPAGGETPPSTL